MLLPALQALTGCDTTSKICRKNAALKIVEIGIAENLVGKHLLKVLKQLVWRLLVRQKKCFRTKDMLNFNIL